MLHCRELWGWIWFQKESWGFRGLRKIKKLNEENSLSGSIMIDTKGSQICVVDHGAHLPWFKSR